MYYTRLGKGVSATGKKLDLPPEPLPYAVRKRSFAFAFLCLAMGVAFAAVTVFLSLFFGLGTQDAPFKVRDQGSLASALKAGYDVTLDKDLSLSAGATTYDGNMEGNDHIVRLHSPFAETYRGEMCDVIFVLESDFAGDAVILENQGTLKNVRVVAEELSLSKGGEYRGLLTAVNKGTIDACYATFSVTITGDAGGDCYFAPFAGSNEGVIHNCHADGTVDAQNVDLGGVVGKNEKTGTITDCVVNAALSERSDIKGWTPNVAGVADHNEGAIYGCEVKGSVASVLVSPALEEGDRTMSAYAAGVVCVNVCSVTDVVNRASVTAESTNGSAFAGGIVALNTTLSTDLSASGNITHSSGLGAVRALAHTENNAYAGGVAALNDQGSTISASRGTASVSAESPDRYYDFTGGIAGSNGGVIEKSFFLGTLPSYDEDSLVGAICGLIYLRGGFFTNYTIDLSNNAYCVEGAHTSGAVIAENQYKYLMADRVYSAYVFENTQGYGGYVDEVLEFGATSATLEELKAMEVYYE